MSDLTKLTKAQLIDVIEQQEENKWDNFKEEFGVTYNTDEEWIEFFKSIQKTTEERIQKENRKIALSKVI
tara:strand:- start:142 stop:351 length:210 start_codon:yes stop_codon:yes gene_type:complete